MGRRNKGFNTPFSDLKQRVTEPPASEKPQPAPPKVKPRDEDAAPDDDALFRAMMGDVKPLDAPARAKGRVDPPKKRVLASSPAEDEDAEALAVLSDLVAGEGPMDVMDTEEYVEGIAPGIDHRLLRRLKHGDFSVQGHLDLHGMVREEARRAVETFIRVSRLNGKRCVLIVHGRGLNSPDREPILKQALVRWLSRGGLGKQVLAFATARPHDGGGGATYVLLRR